MKFHSASVLFTLFSLPQIASETTFLRRTSALDTDIENNEIHRILNGQNGGGNNGGGNNGGGNNGGGNNGGGNPTVPPQPTCNPNVVKPCIAEIKGNGEHDKFKEIGNDCCKDEECEVLSGPIVVGGVEEYSGICVPDKCTGKPNPDENHRVTICHRTCSDHNPWVRITIDNSAWTGPGCGHMNHKVDKCTTEPEVEIDSIWGGYSEDYLIKDHLAKAEYPKEYWKIWEPACPSHKNGICCDPLEGECCGIPEDEPIPRVELNKTVLPGVLTTCEGTEGSEYIEVEEGMPFTFCYHVCNKGETQLCNFTVVDPTDDYSETDPSCLDSGMCLFMPPNPYAFCVESDESEKATVNAEVVIDYDFVGSVKDDDNAVVDVTLCSREKEKLENIKVKPTPCMYPQPGWPLPGKLGPQPRSICYPQEKIE